MVRKNQIKKFAVEKIRQLSKTQTDGQILKLFAQQIQTKNGTLTQKRDELIKQISRVRKDTYKTIKQMNETVKERLNRKQRIVMDRTSRPTIQNIKQLTDLFTYMQNQAAIMDRNNKDIQKVYCQKQKQLQQLIQTPKISYSYKEYDQKYQSLKIQCMKEDKIKEQVNKVLQKNRAHYSTIKQTIQQYRIKYQIVQEKIAEKQRELDHLITYLKVRQEQDNENIKRQNHLTQILQNQLLKAQNILNFSASKKQELQIKQIECLK